MMRRRLSVSTPAGTLTDKVFTPRVRPAPRQLLHGSLITFPVPEQVKQVLATLKKPCWKRTCPRPPQAWQAIGAVPDFAPLPPQLGQTSLLGILIRVLIP